MDDLALAKRAGLRWNTPLSQEHADLLLGPRLAPRPGDRIADVGCGWAELLRRAVARVDGTTGVGVDTDDVALRRGREALGEMAGRIELVRSSALDWDGTADRVLCIGAAHAFGGSRAALTALRSTVRGGGRLLYGDGCWPGEPTAAALDVLGDGILPLRELAAAAREAGWRVLHLSTADQREWDDFESSFRAGWSEWLACNGSDPRTAEVRAWLDAREVEYLSAYRGVLGFAYLVLVPY